MSKADKKSLCLTLSLGVAALAMVTVTSVVTATDAEARNRRAATSTKPKPGMMRLGGPTPSATPSFVDPRTDPKPFSSNAKIRAFFFARDRDGPGRG